MWQSLRTAGLDVVPDSAQPVGGGSINESWRVSGADGGRYFVKFNSAERLAMFEAEAAGLDEIAATGTVRVPAVAGLGTGDGRSWLALEYLELGTGDPAAASRLGRRLASLHGCRAKRFGWHRDNTIGSTPQVNTPTDDWIVFFRECRLGFQLELAERRGARRLAALGAELCDKLPAFFEGVEIEPVLLHGDLWGGNWSACKGEPVIYDPAVYYGDRETDIAMTSLFGGFSPAFYESYRAVWPDLPGGEHRRQLYRLYHVLNHDHLFGGGYGAQAERMMEHLLGDKGQ